MKNPSKKRNSWEWLEKKHGGIVGDILKGKRPSAPAHVEIHPHHHSTIMCNNSCPSCTGGYYRRKNNLGIEPNRLIKTIDGFRGRVGEVMYSGCFIEPLLYPDINETVKHIKSADLRFVLYSNFYYGDRPGLIEQLTTPKSDDDVVRISLDAGSNDSYNLVHNPLDKNSFYKIKDNVKALLRAKRNTGSSIYVSLTYLLTNDNSSREELESIVEWACHNEGIDNLRFGVYQKPIKRGFPTSAKLGWGNLEKIRYFLYDLKRDFKREGFDVQIQSDKILETERAKSFSKCFVHDVFGVVGFDGGVYPCTAMSSPCSPKELLFGNINYEDFWDIWERKNGDFSIEKCVDCTRAEYEVNSRISEIVGDDNR